MHPMQGDNSNPYGGLGGGMSGRLRRLSGPADVLHVSGCGRGLVSQVEHASSKREGKGKGSHDLCQIVLSSSQKQEGDCLFKCSLLAF